MSPDKRAVCVLPRSIGCDGMGRECGVWVSCHDGAGSAGPETIHAKSSAGAGVVSEGCGSREVHLQSLKAKDDIRRLAIREQKLHDREKTHGTCESHQGVI